MSELDSVARVVINVRDGAVSRQGFGVPLILAFHNHTPGRVKSYSRWEEMLVDGFSVNDAAVRQAKALKSAGVSSVPRFLVGKLLTAPPAKVVTLTPTPDVRQHSFVKIGEETFSTIILKYTPTVANSTPYSVTLNGGVYTFTSDASATGAEITGGLAALINGDPAAPVTASGTSTQLILTARSGLDADDVEVSTSANMGAPAAPTAAELVTTLTALINASAIPVTASGTGTLVLTADAAGEPFALETSEGWSMTETTTWDTAAKTALTEDLVAIRNADSSWYALLASGSSTDEILTLAAAVEGMDATILFASTGDAGVLSGESENDVGAQGEALGYNRTAVMHTDHPGTYPMTTLAGVGLPRAPGSMTFSYKRLNGQKARAYGSEEITQLEARNMLRYTTIAGRDVTRNGKMLGGQWIDITIGIDFMKARIQEEIFSTLAGSPKVPMTQAGAESIGAAVRLALSMAEENEIIEAGTWQVTVPTVAEMSSTDRQNRHLRPVTWFARFVGAIESVLVEGDVMF